MAEKAKEYKVERHEAYIAIDELMRDYFDFGITHSKCQECSGYKKTWACPNFDFEPEAFLRSFSGLNLIVDRVYNSGAETACIAQERLFSEKKRFDREMRELEKENPGSYGMAAQECVACKKCVRLSGHPCIHPDIMRYGPEAIGIIAAKLVPDKFGFPLLWSDGVSIPEYYVLCAGILIK